MSDEERIRSGVGSLEDDVTDSMVRRILFAFFRGTGASVRFRGINLTRLAAQGYTYRG